MEVISMPKLETKPKENDFAALEEILGDDLEKTPSSENIFLKLIIHDYPQFRFCLNQKRFAFKYAAVNSSQRTKPARKKVKPTIFIGQPQPFFALQALHELGHALCKHKDYTTHVERLKIESSAWQMAKTVLEKYQKTAKKLMKSADSSDVELGEKIVAILPEWNQEYVEDCLDTYRDWLHLKSKCGKCGLTRYQTKDGKYHCPYCDTFSKG